MNKERRVGRRSVVQNLVKLTPEYDIEEKTSKGPKKALFDDDSTFVMRRTLKPLHEINNFQFSSSKSKSHERLYEENTYEAPKSTYMDMFSKHNKIPLSPPSRIGMLESSMIKKRREPIEPVLQSKELFNTLIDSPCTKYEKAQFNNALSSASKYLLNRHLDSVSKNIDIFKETTPEANFNLINENHVDDFKTPSLIDRSISPMKELCQADSTNQTSSLSMLVEEIEEQKKNEIDDIRQTKQQCCDWIKTRFKEIELEIEKHFSVMENKFTENYDKLLKKVQDEKNDITESQSSNTTVETVKEKDYTRMTGAFGILNNLNTDCSFLKTPKTKGKTREEMLNKGTLTPCTMSFVLQEQLMHLNSSS